MPADIVSRRNLRTTPNGLDFLGKMVAVGAFPIGIDPEKFYEGLQKEKVQKRIATLEQKFQGVKVIVGVDRLDYIKGIPHKLHALEVFLTKHPEWVGKVVFVQVAVPSRQDVEDYQNLRTVINELVGKINGQFGMYWNKRQLWPAAVIAPYTEPVLLTPKRHCGIYAYPFPPQICQFG